MFSQIRRILKSNNFQIIPKMALNITRRNVVFAQFRALQTLKQKTDKSNESKEEEYENEPNSGQIKIKVEDSVERPSHVEENNIVEKIKAELKDTVHDDSKPLPPQVLDEIMETMANDLSDEVNVIFAAISEEMPKASKEVRAKEVINRVKDFINLEENWTSGKMGSLLTDCDISPALWEKSLDYYIKEDDEISHQLYTNFAKVLLEKSQLKELNEEEKLAIKQFLETKLQEFAEHEGFKKVTTPEEDERSKVVHSKIADAVEEKYNVNVNPVRDTLETLK